MSFTDCSLFLHRPSATACILTNRAGQDRLPGRFDSESSMRLRVEHHSSWRYNSMDDVKSSNVYLLCDHKEIMLVLYHIKYNGFCMTCFVCRLILIVFWLGYWISPISVQQNQYTYRSMYVSNTDMICIYMPLPNCWYHNLQTRPCSTRFLTLAAPFSTKHQWMISIYSYKRN